MWSHARRSRPRHPCRSRTVRSIRVLVLRLVRENPGWGIAGCGDRHPPTQLRATPRTWWPTLPCGRSRPRSPPCALSRSGCRSRRAGAIGGSWYAALGTLLWAGLVRVTLLQHVTWSVNSLCHVVGARPFTTRRHDRATNLWPPALLSLGESWHNMHHSDPACARHGADPRQIEISDLTVNAVHCNVNSVARN